MADKLCKSSSKRPYSLSIAFQPTTTFMITACCWSESSLSSSTYPDYKKGKKCPQLLHYNIPKKTLSTFSEPLHSTTPASVSFLYSRSSGFAMD